MVGLTSYERLLLFALLYLEDRREAPKGATFQASNWDLVHASGISIRSIPAVRRRLVEKGLISIFPGGAGKSTRYTIRWDQIGQKGS